VLDPHGDVSVIIVTYRTPEVLAECLHSFELHRPRRVGEVVVVDNSVELEDGEPVETFPWIVYHRNERNEHFRRGVNKGVSLARLPYVMILNPDTYLTYSESIATLADVLDRDARIGFVGPMMRGDDGSLAPQGERLADLVHLVAFKTLLNAFWPNNPLARRHQRPDFSREQSGRVDTVSAGALLCRRDEFLAAGGFDPRVSVYWEEHELARKYRALGLSGYYCASAFVFHRWRKGGTEHSTQLESQQYFEESMRLYYRMFYGRFGAALYAALEGLRRVASAVRRLPVRSGSVR
jgi:N-acetylglucosaminyl-diphospho-decaprenol L-rhamnosyltransferase